jgi:exopolysaccharide biosynthesis polyprenyl glycosylphosphotransferase
MSELEIASHAPERASLRVATVRLQGGYRPDRLLRRILAGADLGAVAATAAVVGVWGSGVTAAVLLGLCAPVWIVAAKLAGLYDRDQRTLRHLTVDELPWLVVWALSVTAFLTLVVSPFPALGLRSSDLLLLWGSSLGFAFILRATARPLWRKLTPPERVLLVGSGPLAEAVARKLQLFPDIHAEITDQIENCVSAPERLSERDVDRVVVASSELSENVLEELLSVCRMRGFKLTVVPPTRGMFGTATHLAHVADLPLLDYNTWYVSASTLAMKRVFDVLVAVLGLVALSPLFLVIGLGIVVDDGRPILFRQPRAGQGGNRFRIFKFRTMVRDAEERLGELVSFDDLEQPLFKLKFDPRVTRFGRFLRRTSLDELPQLLNVLYGEMSIVGPRPELVGLAERYSPEHEFRLQVKPGITGPWQIYGRSELTWDEVLAVEREYVENLSIARDVRILLMTLPAVFGRRGAF